MNKNKNYRILTFSNGVFQPQYKFLGFFWFNFDQVFKDIANAKAFVKAEIANNTKPTVLNVSYIED